MLSGQGKKAAKSAVERLRGKYADGTAVQAEVDDMAATTQSNKSQAGELCCSQDGWPVSNLTDIQHCTGSGQHSLRLTVLFSYALQQNSAFCAGIAELLQGSNLRPLTIGMSLMLLQQITGQPSVLYYAVSSSQNALKCSWDQIRKIASEALTASQTSNFRFWPNEQN